MRVELSVHPDVLLDEPRLREAVARAAGVPLPDVERVVVQRRSIDARRGRVRVHLVVELLTVGEPASVPHVEPIALPTLRGEPEVAIVGAGPAGLFCAWALARRGVRSVILERGKPVRPRRRDLATLTRHGILDPESNYCFGEGGAGTFSDGKLYTRAHKRGDISQILEAFVAYGASPEILVDARPHIGTNKLPAVVTRMREHLESAGVLVRFGARVDALAVRDGTVAGVRLADGTTVDARAVVVAPGHSARDVHRFVAAAGASVCFKPFAIGVRVEHPQAFVDRIQFGALAGHPALGAASYRLVERGAFSFCMCPGGFIAPAATEPEGQVVNGWSPSSRGGRFANSGFVVEVGAPELAAAGLDPDDPFAGVAYQRAVEQRAYAAGGGLYVAPAQRLDDFVVRRPSRELPPCSYPRGLAGADLDFVLGPLADPLRAALRSADAKLPGFASAIGVAVGVESRTSSPVRIDRDRETAQSPTLSALYPCGEGAGHAGGIMSAALDALRVAARV
jgi:hypothetical protein